MAATTRFNLTATNKQPYNDSSRWHKIAAKTQPTICQQLVALRAPLQLIECNHLLTELTSAVYRCKSITEAQTLIDTFKHLHQHELNWLKR